MKHILLITLFIFLPLLSETATQCYVAENNVIEWEFRKDNTIKFTAHINKGSAGYGGFGFKDLNSTELFMAVGIQQNSTYDGEVNPYLIVNGTQFVLQEKQNFSGAVMIDDKFVYLSPMFLSFEVIIPQNNSYFQFKNQLQHLVIAVNEHSRPQSPFEMDAPTQMIIREVNFFSSYDCKLYTHGRLADFHFSIIITEAVIYLLLLVLCILWRNKQPLKSRAFTPYLAVISQLIYVLIRIFYIFDLVWDLETSNKYFCHVVSFMSNPVVILSISLLPLNAFRYLFIVNLNKRKQVIQVGEDGKISKVKFYVKVFKWIVKPWFSLVILAFVMLLWCTAAIIISGIYKFDCPKYTDYVNEYMYTAFFSLLAVIMIIVLLYDVTMNIKKVVTCKLKSLFFEDDAFYFRIEMYIYLALFVYYLITDIALDPFTSRMTRIILRSIGWYSLVAQQCVFPLSITIIQSFRQKIGVKQKQQESSFNQMLAKKELHDLFAEYCKSEWSVENILLWDELQQYEKTKDPTRREELAMRIYEKYLQTNAQLEINVDRATVARVRMNLFRKENMDNLFHEIHIAVSQNLMDIFSRFILTSQYRHYVKVSELKDELKKTSMLI